MRTSAAATEDGIDGADGVAPSTLPGQDDLRSALLELGDALPRRT